MHTNLWQPTALTVYTALKFFGGEMKTKILMLVLCAGLLGTMAQAAESSDQTVDDKNPQALYVAGRYQEAHKIWLNQAKAGDSYAQYAIGMAFFYGQNGTIQNKKVGLVWLNKAAHQNQEDAMIQLMNLYYDGVYVAKDEMLAVDWARKLEQLDGLEQLKGVQFLANWGSQSTIKAELDRAIERFERFISEDTALYFEQYRLGVAYASRAGLTHAVLDKEKARAWFRISEKNSPEGFKRFPSLERYSVDDESGEIVRAEYERDLAQAEKGNAQAQFQVVRYLRRYEKNNLVDVFKWLSKAAAQNHPEALYQMGVMHSDASSCLENILSSKHPDVEGAARIVRNDGQPVDAWAANETMCSSGGLSKNVMQLDVVQLVAQSKSEADLALDFYQKAASLNQPDALYQMYVHEYYRESDGQQPCVMMRGFIIKSVCEKKTHDGVSERHQKAFAFLLKAGEKGDTSAPDDLGAHYWVGEIVPKNLTESLRWYEKSAEYGISAGVNLKVAQFYCKGMGVPKNDDLCRYHLQKGEESLGDDVVLEAEDLGLMPYVRQFLKAYKKVKCRGCKITSH